MCYFVRVYASHKHVPDDPKSKICRHYCTEAVARSLEGRSEVESGRLHGVRVPTECQRDQREGQGARDFNPAHGQFFYGLR